MTRKDARAYFIDSNERIISVAKDENSYNYKTQQIEDVFMRRTFEANEWAIKALEQTRWIPVESALPEVVVGELDIRCSEDVLVYDGADLRVGYFVRIEKFDRGYWNIYGDDCFEPIEWMPLPLPFRAESEV